jgi:hypothetical protein
MDNNLSMEELEMEQLDYLRRNYDDTMALPNEVDMNLNILEKPLDDRILLSPLQEKKLVEEVIKRQKEASRTDGGDYSFSLSRYFNILTESFVETMDDLLNFKGDLNEIPHILTKNDRLVLVGTILVAISLVFIVRFPKST